MVHDKINVWMNTARGFYIMITGVLLLLVSGVTTWTTTAATIDTLEFQVDTLNNAVEEIESAMAKDDIREATDALNMQNMKTTIDSIDGKLDRLMNKLLD